MMLASSLGWTAEKEPRNNISNTLSNIEIQTLLQNTPNLIAVLDGEWKMEVDCPPYIASSREIKFLSGEISGSIRGMFINGSVEKDGTIAIYGENFRFIGNVKDWQKGEAVGTISNTGGKCAGTWILIKTEALYQYSNH